MEAAMSHCLIDSLQGNRFGNTFQHGKGKKIGTLRKMSVDIRFVAMVGVCSSHPRHLTPDSNCSFIRLFSAIAIRIDDVDDSSLFIVRDP